MSLALIPEKAGKCCHPEGPRWTREMQFSKEKFFYLGMNAPLHAGVQLVGRQLGRKQPRGPL